MTTHNQTEGEMSKRADESSEWPGMSVAELRDAYDEESLEGYERIERFWHLWTGRYRRRMFGDVEGRVIDIGCGPGANLRYISETADLVAVDISADMLERARKDAAEIGRSVEFRQMDAQNLAFEDDSFDVVVSGLSTCTFPDPVKGLNEMARVCKPDGQVRLLEHGKSSFAPYAKVQEWRRDEEYGELGCRLYDDPADVVEQSTLEIKAEYNWWIGTLTGIVATPPEA